MCGIAGILSATSGKFNVADIENMTAAMAHRGPDGRAVYINESATVFLGHCRLAIIDPEPSAAQPMHYDSRYSIIHNGEIYNYLELSVELLKKGYHFKTRSDTEVILAAYDCYKEKCLEHFDGMFAFAIWDAKEKTLFAARDRFGEKPFYYSLDEKAQTFCFASELKALWAMGLPRSIDENRLLSFLALGYTSHPTLAARSFYKNALRLPAAHFLKLSFKSGQIHLNIVRYWNLDKSSIQTLPEIEAIDKFRELFMRSVQYRLRSDASIGTSLSGGLDSSSVVWAIHHQKQVNPNYQQKTFTASFPGYEKDESNDAKVIASQFHLQQEFCYPNADSFAKDIAKLISIHEEPISSASVYAQYKVFELAREHGVKVLLDGQGADEILAGYSKYSHWYLQELLRTNKISKFLREKKTLVDTNTAFEWGIANYAAALFPTAAANRLQKNAARALENHQWINPEFSRAYKQESDTFKPAVRTLNDLLHYNTLDFGLEELLRYADKNSMAHGREVRLPFLQHELVQFVFSLPSSLKINQGYSKWLLRKTMQNNLPDNIVWQRNKTGFEPPQKLWMENSGVQAQIRLAKERLVSAGVLNKSVLQEKIQPHSAYAADNNDWRYLTAGLLI